MKTVDLHTHSTASDGTYTPTELVKAAKKADLSAMALTDHDTISGIGEAMNAAKSLDLELIPGVEISTFYKDKEIHIVGLCLDYQDPALTLQLGDELSRRFHRNQNMVQKFQEAGFPVTLEDLETMFPDSVLTRAHFAAYMVKKGFVKNNQEAFDKYLGDGKPLYVNRDKKSSTEAIRLIRDSKGVAILAHPLLYHLTGGELRSLCQELKEAGLTGIESMYSTYKGFDELTVRKMAHEFQLLESGGSDFHGANKPHIAIGTGMGNLMIHYDFLEKIKEAANYSPLE